MGYFGGLGAGKGWLKCLFLVSTKDLRHVLAGTNAFLVMHNSRVPADYVATPLTEYIEAYARYLDAILESTEAAKRSAMETHMGLAASLDGLSFEPCPDARYKLIDSDEPFVNLGPLMLHYDGKRLSTNVYSHLYFGLEMSFPRVISLDRDGFEVLYETAKFPTYKIFEEIRANIQRWTSPCKVRSPIREHRTSVRITEEMRELMKRHPGLKEANLEVL